MKNHIIAAIGTRGLATPVQYALGNNGANGLYRATMPAADCPTFPPITTLYSIVPDNKGGGGWYKTDGPETNQR